MGLRTSLARKSAARRRPGPATAGNAAIIPRSRTVCLHRHFCEFVNTASAQKRGEAQAWGLQQQATPLLYQTLTKKSIP